MLFRLQSKQKSKIYLIINTFVNASKILQAIEIRKKETLRLRENKESKKNYFN
jgi:hypothetical protein